MTLGVSFWFSPRHRSWTLAERVPYFKSAPWFLLRLPCSIHWFWDFPWSQFDGSTAYSTWEISEICMLLCWSMVRRTLPRIEPSYLSIDFKGIFYFMWESTFQVDWSCLRYPEISFSLLIAINIAQIALTNIIVSSWLSYIELLLLCLTVRLS